MKNLSFLVLLFLAMVAASCGKKDESSSSGSSSSAFRVSSNGTIKPETKAGYINMLQSQQCQGAYTIMVGSVTYQIADQQSCSIVHQAVQTAFNANIPAINGNQLKVKVTGYVPSTGQYQVGGQYGQQAGNILYITQAVVYR